MSAGPDLSLLSHEQKDALIHTLVAQVAALSSVADRELGLPPKPPRTETIQFTYLNSDLLQFAADPARRDCSHYEPGLQIDGDLKIREFLFDKATLARFGNLSGFDRRSNNFANLSAADKKLQSWQWAVYNTFSEEITFVAAFGGSLTPTWKLYPISDNSSGPPSKGQKAFRAVQAQAQGQSARRLAHRPLHPNPTLRADRFGSCPARIAARMSRTWRMSAVLGLDPGPNQVESPRTRQSSALRAGLCPWRQSSIRSKPIWKSLPRFNSLGYPSLAL